jgi:hypothetical protein
VAALRHLDLAGPRCFVEYELRRVRCGDCGARVEAVPWARPRARHTRDFEDVVAFCAQQMAKTPITALLRVGWDTVGAIVERVVVDHLDADRLSRLVMIGEAAGVELPALSEWTFTSEQASTIQQPVLSVLGRKTEPFWYESTPSSAARFRTSSRP